MASKAASVLEYRTGSYGRQATLDQAPTDFPERSDHGSTRDRQHPNFESEHFHIAIVPQEKSSSDLASNRSTLSRVFVLPLTWPQLLQKVQAQIRATESRAGSMGVRFGDVKVDFVTMQVIRSNRPVSLTAQQFKLLRFLALNPERVFSRNELLNEVWGYNSYPTTRTVDNHISILRRKLEPDPARPVHFRTVHGMGYKFVPLTS